MCQKYFENPGYDISTQSQAAVTAYLECKQLPLFDLAGMVMVVNAGQAGMPENGRGPSKKEALNQCCSNVGPAS